MTILCRIASAVCLALVIVANFAAAASRPKDIKDPPQGYEHDKYAPNPDIKRTFRGFVVSFDSKDDDDGDGNPDLLRVPHWVAQEIRRWQPEEELQDDDDNWCLDTLRTRPSWFTDPDLFASGVAPNDDSYRDSGFDRGHMAMKLLVERLGQDAAWNTHTVLNAIPDAAFKIVLRNKTKEEKMSATDEKGELEILAFLYPQLGPGYFGPTREHRHERFLTSVEEIETLTGLDFPVVKTKTLERRIKRRRANELWDPSVVDSKAVDQKGKPIFLSGCRGQ